MFDNRHTSLFIEKYRPSNIAELVGNEDIKKKLAEYIEKEDIPHLLLHGNTPGTGKTSSAMILINSIPCDYLWINASNENGIDTVRNKILNFASTIGLQPIKIIVCDEFDYFSTSAMASLRGIIEQYAETTRFIFTANYIDKVIDPIISRCQVLHVVPPSKKEVAIHLVDILKKEQIQYDIQDIKILLDSYFPDIRKLIGECQLHSSGGKLVLGEKSLIIGFKDTLLNLIKSKEKFESKLTQIRQLLADSDITDYISVYRELFDKVDQLSLRQSDIPSLILAIHEGLYKHGIVLDKEINCCATLINILQILEK